MGASLSGVRRKERVDEISVLIDGGYDVHHGADADANNLAGCAVHRAIAGGDGVSRAVGVGVSGSGGEFAIVLSGDIDSIRDMLRRSGERSILFDDLLQGVGPFRK